MHDTLMVDTLMAVPLNPCCRMFNAQVFRSWAHILVGATVFALFFLLILLMGEHVAGSSARLSRATVAVSVAAFVGYVGTACIIRLDLPDR
jgi:hypothetical protein